MLIRIDSKIEFTPLYEKTAEGTKIFLNLYIEFKRFVSQIVTAKITLKQLLVFN